MKRPVYRLITIHRLLVKLIFHSVKHSTLQVTPHFPRHYQPSVLHRRMVNQPIQVSHLAICDIIKVNAYRLNAASHNISKKSDLLDR